MLLEQLGVFGGNIIDTLSDITESIGTNSMAHASANEAVAQSLVIKNQLAAVETSASIERKKQQMDLLKNVVYVIMALVFIAMVTSIFIKLKKTK